MLYAISNRYGKDTIMVNEGVYKSLTEATKRVWQLAEEAKVRLAKAYKVKEEDVKLQMGTDGDVWIYWLTYSNIFQVVELEEH